MLTQEQEDFVRRQHRDSTPLKSVNDFPQPTGFAPLVPNAELEAWKSEPKMQPKSLNDDPMVESKLRDAGFKGANGEFYSTVGIGRERILAMSKSELRAAIEAAKGRDDVPAPRTRFAIGPEARPRGPQAILV